MVNYRQYLIPQTKLVTQTFYPFSILKVGDFFVNGEMLFVRVPTTLAGDGLVTNALVIDPRPYAGELVFFSPKEYILTEARVD